MRVKTWKPSLHESVASQKNCAKRMTWAKKCTEWSLDVRALHVITDSGANVKKAMSQMPIDKWRPCFAHTLQLVVNGALASKEVSDLPKIITKARAIVSHFRRSPLASTQLEKAQDQLQLTRSKLLQDCPTRRNSQVGHQLL